MDAHDLPVRKRKIKRIKKDHVHFSSIHYFFFLTSTYDAIPFSDHSSLIFRINQVVDSTDE